MSNSLIFNSFFKRQKFQEEFSAQKLYKCKNILIIKFINTWPNQIYLKQHYPIYRI